jgi:hypothetical protein
MGHLKVRHLPVVDVGDVRSGAVEPALQLVSVLC